MIIFGTTRYICSNVFFYIGYSINQRKFKARITFRYDLTSGTVILSAGETGKVILQSILITQLGVPRELFKLVTVQVALSILCLNGQGSSFFPIWLLLGCTVGNKRVSRNDNSARNKLK